MLWGLARALSTAIYRGLQRFAPTNIALRRLRQRHLLRWGVPAGLAGMTLYLVGLVLASEAIRAGGPQWLNLLVLLFFWNAAKFAVWVPVSLVLLVAARAREHRGGRLGRDYDAVGASSVT